MRDAAVVVSGLGSGPVVRGLRQALLMVLASGAVALALATLWTVIGDGEFRPAFGITLMVIAALLALTGSDLISRTMDVDVRAMTGKAAASQDPNSGAALAPVGVFLFVSVPLFVIGGLLYGTG